MLCGGRPAGRPPQFLTGWAELAFKRWLYRGGHPNQLAKILNRGWAFIHALGVAPNYMVTLDVAGRQSGKTISFPLAMVTVGGERYLVSMLGEDANWVRNVAAAGGRARLRHGKTEDVRLVAVDIRPASADLEAVSASGAGRAAAHSG